MKLLLTAALSILSVICFAQITTICYDNNWAATTREKATYYADFEKAGNMYKCTSYWIAGNKLRGKSTYPDTLMMHPVGSQVLYFQNGHVEDSVFYSDQKRLYVYHYYPGGRLAAHYYIPDGKDDAVIEGFDEDGKKIKNYVFEKEAAFKGGPKAWAEYIQKNVSKDLKVKSDVDVTAEVQIHFIVNQDGEVSTAKIFKSSGYPQVDKDALRVIKESPPWKGAIQFNRPVNAYRVQPFVYKLEAEKKKETGK